MMLTEQAPRDVVPPLHVVVTGLPSDAHTWNLVFIQLLLEDLGHRVTNLGPCPSVAEVADECAARRPDLLVVSTVNGHGLLDAPRLLDAVRDRCGLAAPPVVIGGKLGVTGAGGAGPESLRAHGYDAVFGDEDSLDGFMAYVDALRHSQARETAR